MIQCPTVTKKGTPCPISGERNRNGFCHIHDPVGTYRQQHPYRTKRKEPKVAKNQRQLQEKDNLSKSQERQDRRRNRKNTIIKYASAMDTAGRCAYIKRGRQCKKIAEYEQRFCSNHLKQGNRRLKKAKATSIDMKEHIYLFFLGYSDLYKIGKSRNVQRRLSNLKAANLKLQHVHDVPVCDGLAAEKVIHTRYGSKRVAREIFKFDVGELQTVIGDMNRLKEDGRA